MTDYQKKKLNLATRGSKLALWQAHYVSELLSAKGVNVNLEILKTTADRIQDRPLQEIGGKGLFIKELEEALLNHSADLAVHSLKDMTARLDSRFKLAAVLKRHAAGDLLIFRSNLAKSLNLSPNTIADWTPQNLENLGPITIGTGSLRRQAILGRLAPHLKTVPIRGNVDTRLKKLEEGAWDAIILAHASIERLALKGLSCVHLHPSWFIPCAGQGALAIETRSNDLELNNFLGALGDPNTTSAVETERGVLAKLGGDCNMPFGCHVRFENDMWHASAGIYDLKGNGVEIRASLHQRDFRVETFIDRITNKLREAGAKKILENLNLEIPEAYQ